MIASFRLSFGNARMRARKSFLRSAWTVRLLGTASGLAAYAEGLGLPPAHDADELERLLFDSLIDDYARILEDYAAARPLLHALLARHEVENVKLAWRALSRRLPATRWIRLWRPFGRLETIPLDAWRDASSLAEAVRRSSRTPWGAILRETLDAHEDDADAAELALDRFAFARVADEAERLPRREATARRLALSLVFERDLDTLHRRAAFSGLSPELAGAATVRLARDLPEDALSALAAWRSGQLPFDLRLPGGVDPRIRNIRDWDRLTIEIRRERLTTCRRAFTGPPFRLAPAVAFLLVREAETRGLAALASLLPPRAGRTADAGLRPALDRVLAPSLLGD